MRYSGEQIVMKFFGIELNRHSPHYFNPLEPDKNAAKHCHKILVKVSLQFNEPNGDEAVPRSTYIATPGRP